MVRMWTGTEQTQHRPWDPATLGSGAEGKPSGGTERSGPGLLRPGLPGRVCPSE